MKLFKKLISPLLVALLLAGCSSMSSGVKVGDQEFTSAEIQKTVDEISSNFITYFFVYFIIGGIKTFAGSVHVIHRFVKLINVLLGAFGCRFTFKLFFNFCKDRECLWV